MTRKTLRSLTLHYPVKNWSRLTSEVTVAIQKLEEASDFLKSKGFEVWSKRLTITTPPIDVSVEKTAEKIKEAVDIGKILVSLGGFSVKDKRLGEIKNAIMSGFYVFFETRSWDDLNDAASIIYSWSQPPYEHMTRIGIDLLGDPSFITPYFPLSRAPALLSRPVFSLSFMLPKALLELLENKGFEGMIDYLFELSLSSIKYLKEYMISKNNDYGIAGVDLSLSPWMDDSVGELIEKVGSCTIGDLRCIPVIYRINKIINEVSSSLPRSTGFNEIMLAVAEDSLLKKRVYEGKLSLRSLLETVPVCLAGLDMFALRTSKERLLDLLLTLKAYSESKRRTVGFRAIILPESSDEEKIMTKKFGDIPVFDLI